MRKLILVFPILSLLLISCSSKYLIQEKGFVSLTIDAASWTMQFPDRNFSVKEEKVNPQGVGAYFLLSSDNPSITVSIIIEPAIKCSDPKSCRDLFWSKPNPAYGEPVNVQKATYPTYATVEYTVQEFQGMKINQRHLNAHFVQDGFWIDLHISKMSYQSSDQHIFDELAAGVRFISKPSNQILLSSMDCFMAGSQKFIFEQDFKNAKWWFEKSLFAEERKQEMGMNAYPALIGSLDICYNETGELSKIPELFTKALKRDSTYPIYYYGLARFYGKSNKMDSTIIYLRKAFDYRNNLPSGEKMPQPENDDAFKEYLTNKQFKQCLSDIQKLK